MPRNRKRKRENYGCNDASLMERAIKLVQNGQTIRETATELGIPKSTLQRYVTKASESGIENIRKTPNWRNACVFTDQEEAELEEYLLTAAKHCHGLTILSTKQLAFQYGKKNGKSYPESWNRNERAGDDWFYGFMKRHQQLSVRKPEPTSLSRATSFNRKNVGDFFTNLQNVMQRYNFQPMSIYNCDETGLLTVHKPPNVVAEKKAKQVGQVASAERGTLVTMLGAINAQGNFIPPFLVFPRVYFKDHMVQNAPPGTVGVAHKTGWMTSANFLIWMDHFIKHTKCSKDNPVLLLMDNHESHVSIESIDKAKSNGIVLLTFPPHCSHKLQPLDKTVYGPLKKFYNAACNSWMLSNPGKPMTIYDISSALGESFPRAFCPSNIVSGFKATGIYPFDDNVFKDDEFLTSFVTDRPQIQQTQDNEALSSEDTRQSSANPEHFSPVQVRPFPKAGDRQQKTTNRKKCRTSILTDTPEKAEIERIARDRNERHQKKQQKAVELSESESETEDSDQSEPLINVQDGHFVLVKLSSKKVARHYAGIVLGNPDQGGVVEVKFLSRMLTKTQPVFCYPEKEDIAEVDTADIIKVLPSPRVVGGTKRTAQQFIFDFDFNEYSRLY